jgi:hypothetical protein
VLLWQKEFLKSVFRLTSQTELYIRSFNTMADQSTNQNSTASLAPPPAVYILRDVEAGLAERDSSLGTAVPDHYSEGTAVWGVRIKRNLSQRRQAGSG